MGNLKLIFWVFAAVLAAIFVLSLMVRAIRWARKGTKAASVLAAAAFPFPEQPPPQEQVENVNRLRKDSESGEPE